MPLICKQAFQLAVFVRESATLILPYKQKYLYEIETYS
jgi:hypothetical protein